MSILKCFHNSRVMPEIKETCATFISTYRRSESVFPIHTECMYHSKVQPHRSLEALRRFFRGSGHVTEQVASWSQLKTASLINQSLPLISMEHVSSASEMPGSSYGMGIDMVDLRSSIGHMTRLGKCPCLQSGYVGAPQQASVNAVSMSSKWMQR